MKRKWTVILALIIIAVGIFLNYPTSYYLEVPGSAEDVAKFVKVDNDKPIQNDQFYLTTVGIKKATNLSLFLSRFQPHVTAISSQELTGGVSDEQYLKVQQFFMQNSQNAAIVNAYKKTNTPYNQKYLGVNVLQVDDKSHFAQSLKSGDVITGINGQYFEQTSDLIRYVSSFDENQEIKLEVKRANETLELSGKTMRLEATGKVGIGVSLVDETELTTTPKASINAGAIGGPSAGLMFSLAVYQQLTQEDLTHGQKVAGTGTIDPDGNVGTIGGIDKKVVAASDAGAKVFFAPEAMGENNQTNYEVAKKTAEEMKLSMKIVPVKTFDEALNYLKNTV
ncbi:SepM family pheromone-processing serine protease [Holzapfeliella sp. He02]|uniref:endopeptidase La n=1 Tax=Holzapfeliella saturejae TaxID=3082953 RepID=A0ABU8SG42_9LACO